MQQHRPALRGSENEGHAAINWPAALEEHRRWLRTVVQCRLGDRDAVDDVLQEVALAVLKQNSRPSDPNKVAPWLYRIAVRQTISYRRRQGRRRKLVDAVARRQREEEPVTDPRDWVFNEEVRQAVAAALARLSSQDRQILLLKYAENWCYRQLAEHLGVGVNTVEYRLIRAKKRLRGHLSKLVGVEA